MLSSAAFVVALLTLTNATPAPRKFVVHERRNTAPTAFSKIGTAPADHAMKIMIGLPSKDISGLEAKLYDVNSFLSPRLESVTAVKSYLASHGVSVEQASLAGDWLSISVPVSKANEIFQANYEVFNHKASGKQVVRTLSYSLPQDLIEHVEAIHPTTSFNKPEHAGPIRSRGIGAPIAANTTRAAACSSAITPACLQSLYGIPTTPATQATNSIAVAGFIKQYAQTADLKSFLTKYRPDISSTTTFKLQTLDGGSNPQSARSAGIEANLDVQYTIGIATGVPTSFVSVGSQYQDGTLEGFLDIVNYLSAETPVPQVMTTSYGEDESDISRSVAIKLCNAYLAMGTKGTSVLFASGDGGVSGGQSQTCTKFIPAFPSGCPYLTAVGATQSIPETAASFSSGGFSNYWGPPSYQSTVVKNYITSLGTTYSGKYNASGRGFPDVSAQGVNYQIVNAGTVEGVSGTSCSSPMFASVIALINDKLIAAGKSPLGFLNPFLYANPSVFNDITSGSNPGCNTNGFSAKTGWDPVTGLGTPKYTALAAAAGVA